MAHIRKQVRDAVAAELAAAGLSVHPGRVWPVKRPSMPLVLVYVREEALEPVSMGGEDRLLQREMTLRIEALAESGRTVDDDLDALAVIIEQALANAHQLGGLVRDIMPMSASLSVDGDGERVFGVLRMDMAVHACTPMNDPERS